MIDERCSWWHCPGVPIACDVVERTLRCEEHAGCCPSCGKTDCAGACPECGSALCAGEPHDELCCATGLSRRDREELAEEGPGDG